jgi:hypothetical protein
LESVPGELQFKSGGAGFEPGSGYRVGGQGAEAIEEAKLVGTSEMGVVDEEDGEAAAHAGGDGGHGQEVEAAERRFLKGEQMMSFAEVQVGGVSTA